MTSIVELFPKYRKLAYDLKQQLSQVYTSQLPISEFYIHHQELQRQLQELESTFVPREIPSQRQVWKQKIQELREDVQNLKQQCETFQRQQEILQSQSRYEKERKDILLHRRHRGSTWKSTQSKEEEEETNQPYQEWQDQRDESQSLYNSHNLVSELLMTGQAQLSTLMEQRQRMMGIKSTLVRMGNQLGLSQSTIRMIEKRDVIDLYLILAGMILTCFVFYWVWFR